MVALPASVLTVIPGGSDVKPRLPRWNAAEAVIFALIAIFLAPTLRALIDSAPGVKGLSDSWRNGLAYGFAIPIWLGLSHVRRRPSARSRLLADLRHGAQAFLVLTPITFAVFFFVKGISLFFGEAADEHPLVSFDCSTPLGVSLFFLSACVAAPFLEESAFRGILMPWARQRRAVSLLLFALAVMMLLYVKGYDHTGLLLFLVDLVCAMALAYFGREVWKRWPDRTASSIMATSALFGALHASVWPTPIPLTVLGIGLGVLTARCGSVRPAIVAHGLFNAVSVVEVLRRAGS